MIISDFLYARIGIPHCPKCGKEIKKQTVDQMVDQIMELPERNENSAVWHRWSEDGKVTHVKLLEQCKEERLCPCADRWQYV